MRTTSTDLNRHDRAAARTAGAASPSLVRSGGSLGLLIALGTLACGGPDAHDEAAALRADSSAAGYDVGPLASAPPDTATRGASTPAVPTASPDTLAGRDSSKPPATAAGDSSAARARATTEPGPGERAVPPRDTVRPILIARTRVNEFLEYNLNTRTAYIDIVATRAAKIDSLSVAGDTLAFNRARTGMHSVTIPLGWHVVGQFVNRDSVHAHSAIVIEEAYPLPTVPPPAAFPQAFTRGVEDGLATNVRDEITFTADREGRFLIVCGVPGHAEGGQRMQLVVTQEVNVPAYGR